MRVKIMLLPGNPAGKIMCHYAEQILTDVSAAFNHSFSLMSEKIGEDSIAAYQEPLTEETVDACENCRAVFLGDAMCPGADDLYDALALPVRIRSFSVPEVLCTHHEAPVSLWLAQMLSIDPETLSEGTQTAFRFAQEMEANLCHVAPTGAAKADWEKMLQMQQSAHPLVSASSLSAPEAIAALIESPYHMGVLLCPPYAGSIFQSAALALSMHQDVIHDASFNKEIGVYAPFIPDPEDIAAISPVGAALAVAKLLRFSLGLAVEAGCVEAAVNNVLAADDYTMGCIDRICEQISVAGELMGKSTLNP